jgi:hypothetical protein
MTELTKNPVGLQLKIGRYGKPFHPDKYGTIGTLWGEREHTRPGDALRGFLSYSHVSLIEYEYNGLSVKAYYKYGKWEVGEADAPRFHVWGLLK